MINNIVLDFGHGGLDENGNYTTAPNKMHKFEDGKIAYEGVLNRQIGGHLYTFLKNHQELNIVCTVAEDDPRDISLQQRVRITNRLPFRNTIFVSIHCNASVNHNASGFEIFTTPGITKSDLLATCIAESVEDLYGSVNMRLRYDFSDGDPDKEANFYVIKNTYCPAVLLECGFFDNESDFELLSDTNFQSKLAYKIYQGIINYINKENNT